MRNLRRWRIALTVLVLLGLVLYFANRWLQASCFDGWPAASPPTTHAEAALLLHEATALYQEQRYDAVRSQPLQKPMRADVSGHVATLWVAGSMYAGDFQYAQLWQGVYQRYHRGSRCVHLRLTWKKGSILQQFPPDTL